MNVGNTAILAHELARSGIDVAALSKKFEEKGAGYTFFCQGRPTGEMRTGGVGFAIRSSFLKAVNKAPFGISLRLMRMQLSLEKSHTVTLISCSEPTLGATKEEKDLSYVLFLLLFFKIRI
ncbi:hypothetical protein HELRODRAFT_173117 [Helobdella robusta]|uniref:Uncharacterized protein n=1 Tax=Helobdella robusta TaxID=6412 RepID=T1F6E1_HELRO|nr:hypothetical protein HELRODRAFT_173117 [Helobdella robusta]ESO04046.1 hypothetical protein HELRODRAFT_173117 [Helobdella robusta]